VRIRDFRGSGTYRARIFRNYLWISLLPASFFVLLGAAAIFISQGFVMDELRGLERKTLGQVSDSIELIFREADSIALSLSTDPELIGSLEYSLSIGIPTLTDLRKARAVQSVFASAVNSRRYLHSIYAATPGQAPVPSFMTSSEGLIARDAFPDASWVEGTGAQADVLQGWSAPRNVRLLPGIGYSVPAMTLYRNLVGPGDLSRRGVLAVNVDLRYIDQMIDQGISSLFTETPGGGLVLVHRGTGTALAGRKTTPEETARLLALADGGTFQSSKPVALGSGRYFASAVVSERFPLAYVLLTPESAFYRIPKRIILTALGFAVIALAIGGALIVLSTRRNFVLLDGIIDIVEAAGEGRPLPTFQESKHEEIDYVSLSILRTFVEHDYYKVRLSEQELRRRTLELLALQAQMSPHFLFNTLTSISFKAMALTGKPNDLTRMIEHLSGILAYALKDPRKTVSLREEVENARHYLEIQRLRFSGRVGCEWRIDGNALGASCPRLLLQPLLENATEHGRRAPGTTVNLAVAAALDGDAVRLSVEDDGEGIPPERLAAIRAEAEGEEFSVEHIGLSNTLKRIKLTFGEVSSYDIRSEPGRGTTVEFRFPYVEAPPRSDSSPEDGPRR
jgi:two-component system sensor histidine kinase YesM